MQDAQLFASRLTARAAAPAELGPAAGAYVDVANPRLTDDVSIYVKENG